LVVKHKEAFLSKHLGNHPLKPNYQQGRTTPLKYSIEHLILLEVGIGHHIIPKSLIIAPPMRVYVPAAVLNGPLLNLSGQGV
jgi:hypothetical protein